MCFTVPNPIHTQTHPHTHSHLPTHTPLPPPTSTHNLPPPTPSQIPLLISHANTLLTLLDHTYSPHGGLLSLLPPPHTASRAAAQDTLLGQWIAYTSSLVSRVKEMENEVLALREFAGGDMLKVRGLVGDAVPGGAGAGDVVRGLGRGGGRVLVEGQDAWVVCGVGEGLTQALEREFGVLQREREREGEGDEKRVLWMDTMSRIYRVPESGTFFIVPCYGDLHPSASRAWRMERQPLVQTVVRPMEGRLGEGRFGKPGTGWERGVWEDMEALREENEALRRELTGVREKEKGEQGTRMRMRSRSPVKKN